MAKNCLAELGITSKPTQGPSLERASSNALTSRLETEKRDYFVERDGVRYAGTHLLIEMWGARHLDDPEMIEQTLRESADAAGATILHAHTHRFSPFGGVSGVIVLAESHISIHTWPERDFMALDIFMCGDCNPYESVSVLRNVFRPKSIQLAEHKRGLVL